MQIVQCDMQDRYCSAIGSTIDRKANVYAYVYDRVIYPTLTAIVAGKLWLVMMRMDGVMETSFPPDNPEKYLNNNYFICLGILEELLP
jgi:roadblock/LC7 domain-containing protein